MEKKPLNEGLTRGMIKGIAKDGIEKGGMQKPISQAVKPPPPPPPVAKKNTG